jgi:predicted Rossmann fold nucleotide-binding protein DprA/Smf involved in DNA uptake
LRVSATVSIFDLSDRTSAARRGLQKGGRMNNAQRKAIAQLIADGREIVGKLDDLMSSVETIASEEREKYDNAPEGLQDSEKYQAMGEAADALESFQSAIETISSDLDSAIGDIEGASL